MQDSVTTQLVAVIRTPEMTLFCIFFFLNSELKENKKNLLKKKKKDLKITQIKFGGQFERERERESEPV